MPIDVSILSQFKPQQPEPLLNTLAQFENIRGARQQQEVNALQMQRAKKEFEQEESLNKLLSEPGAFSEQGGVDYDFLSRNAPRFNLGGKIPEFAKLGVAQREAEQKLQAARLERQTKEESLFAETGKRLAEQLRPGMSGAAVKAYFANLYNNDWYARRAPPMEEVLTQIDKAEQSGALDDYIVRVGQSGAVVAQQHTIKNIAREAGEAIQVTKSQGTSKGTKLGPEFSLSGLNVGVAGVEQAVDMGTQLKLMAELAKDRGDFDLVKKFQDEAGQFYRNLEAQYGREYLDYVRGLSDQGFAAAKLALKKATASSVQVGLPPQEKAEQTARGALLVKQYDDVRNRAKVAQRNLQNSAVLERILKSGFETGFTAPIKREASRVLGALGVSAAEDFATNAQVFQAKVSEQVFGLQSLQAGPQTNQDFQRLNETYANIANTTEANKFIIATVRAQAEMAAAEKKFYDDWHKKHKTYDGADAAWDEGPGNKSIFDYPSMKPWTERPKRPAAPAAPAGPRGAPRPGTKPDPAQFFPR